LIGCIQPDFTKQLARPFIVATLRQRLYCG
jgi:hypothetical protein